MPASPLPWFKMWPQAIDHEKIALLPDPVFRTWVHMLAAAAKQPVRGRFASAKHCARVTGRPLAHVRQLVASELLDEAEGGELVAHDWPDWQDVYPSDLTRSDRRRSTANTRTPLGHDSAKKKKEIKTEMETEKPPVSGLETTPKAVAPGDGGLQGGIPPAAVDGQAAGAAVAPRKTTPRKSSRNGTTGLGGVSLGPLVDAFTALGLPKPVLSGPEISAAQVLLKHYAPAVIALGWEAIAKGEYGDDFARRDLSFSYLAGRNRLGNWLRERDGNGRMSNEDLVGEIVVERV
jgi:hypothetical protein